MPRREFLIVDGVSERHGVPHVHLARLAVHLPTLRRRKGQPKADLVQLTPLKWVVVGDGWDDIIREMLTENR